MTARHGFPCCLAGVHLGIIRSTRSTSASNAVCVCFTKFMFVMLPSFSTTKDTTTVPCCFSCLERCGYFKAFVSHRMNSVIPPGNSGSSSTILSGALPSLSGSGDTGVASWSCISSISCASSVLNSILSATACCLTRWLCSTRFILPDVCVSAASAAMMFLSCSGSGGSLMSMAISSIMLLMTSSGDNVIRMFAMAIYSITIEQAAAINILGLSLSMSA